MNVLQALIIEDDRDAAGLCKTVLELEGFECEVVLSAREALARLSAGTPDLILLDIHMGIEISGEDILYQIRGNPRFDQTRVAITTGLPGPAEPIANLADLVLVKPIEIGQLKSLRQRLGGPDFKSKSQAYRDPVTGLFNEEFFLTRLELAFERAERRPDFHFAVIAIDAQAGEQAGPDLTPAILREVAGRLKKITRGTDAVARLAGWKFATLHEDLNDPDEIQFILKRLREKLSRPYEIDGKPHTVKFEIMPVVHCLQYRQPVDLLNAAQKSLNEARAGGKMAA